MQNYNETGFDGVTHTWDIIQYEVRTINYIGPWPEAWQQIFLIILYLLWWPENKQISYLANYCMHTDSVSVYSRGGYWRSRCNETLGLMYRAVIFLIIIILIFTPVNYISLVGLLRSPGVPWLEQCHLLQPTRCSWLLLSVLHRQLW